jgi:hypothetical protein
MVQEGGSSQSFVEGDLVKYSSGQAVIATDGTVNIGVAAQSASGTQATELAIYEINPEQIWSVYADSATTPAVGTHVGGDYDFASFTTNTTYLNLTAAGTDAIVVGLDPRDTPAAGTRVLVRFRPLSMAHVEVA